MTDDKAPDQPIHAGRLAIARRFLRRRFEQGTQYGFGFTISIVVIILALWAWGMVAQDVLGREGIFHIDARLQAFFGDIVTEDRTMWVRALTKLGGFPVITLLMAGMVVLFVFLRQWWLALRFTLGVPLGGAVNEGLKLVFQRVRPLETAGGYSFPSGHAFISTAFFGFLIYLLWTRDVALPLRVLGTLACVALIVLIGMSRVYLNVHWATDVLAGHLGGVLWLTAVLSTIRLIEHPRLAAQLRGEG